MHWTAGAAFVMTCLLVLAFACEFLVGGSRAMWKAILFFSMGIGVSMMFFSVLCV
jgi:hypothetical protein